MVRRVMVLALVLTMAGCAGDGGVADKVLTDWGVRSPDEDYVQGSDTVMARMRSVAETEMRRMNAVQRRGEVKFQEHSGVGGAFYREVKVYEQHYLIDARRISRSSRARGGYTGYIDYAYRMHQSERKGTRVEAAEAEANVPTDITGRDRFSYSFGTSGTWDGAPGQKVRD
jgi:hypothetical protein